MPGDPAKLPPDWIKVQSSAAQPGRDYYFNTKNKKSVWTIREALMQKNNYPPKRTETAEGPIPPVEDHDSSGSEETRRQKPQVYPDMTGFGRDYSWAFNPSFMPINPMYAPNGWPYHMFNQMPFNQFGPVAMQSQPMNPTSTTTAQPVNVKLVEQQAGAPTKVQFPPKDLRHKLEARRRKSCSQDSAPVLTRRQSCPDHNLFNESNEMKSLDSTGDSTEDNPIKTEDIAMGLKHESYGHWLLKDARENCRKDLVYLCIDTNIFIARLSLVRILVEMDTENIVRFMVPQLVSVELDDISKKRLGRKGSPFRGFVGAERPENVRRRAKHANDFLLEMFSKEDGKFVSDTTSSERISKQYNTDDGLINCCLEHISANIHTVLITQDKNLITRALGCRLKVYTMEQIDRLLQQVKEEVSKRELFLKKVKVVVEMNPQPVCNQKPMSDDDMGDTMGINEYTNYQMPFSSFHMQNIPMGFPMVQNFVPQIPILAPTKMNKVETVTGEANPSNRVQRSEPKKEQVKMCQGPTETLNTLKNVTSILKKTVLNRNPIANTPVTPRKKITLRRNKPQKQPSPQKSRTETIIEKKVAENIPNSMESLSTYYPSGTTSNAPSISSDVRSESEDLERLIADKLRSRMDEYMIQYGQVMVELLTTVLLWQGWGQQVPPPWNLHESLSALSRLCRDARRPVAAAAGCLALMVDQQSTTSVFRGVSYTSLCPQTPTAFMQIFENSSKLLVTMKESFEHPDIEVTQSLLDNQLAELKCGQIEKELYGQLGHSIADEPTETSHEETEGVCDPIAPEDKTQYVVDYLTTHFKEWRDSDIRGNSKALQKNEGIDKKMKTVQKKIAAKKDDATKEDKKESGPVIIRMFSNKILEYEEKLKNVEDSEDNGFWPGFEEENYEDEEYAEEDYENEDDYAEEEYGDSNCEQTKKHNEKDTDDVADKNDNAVIRNDKDHNVRTRNYSNVKRNVEQIAKLRNDRVLRSNAMNDNVDTRNPNAKIRNDSVQYSDKRNDNEKNIRNDRGQDINFRSNSATVENDMDHDMPVENDMQVENGIESDMLMENDIENDIAMENGVDYDMPLDNIDYDDVCIVSVAIERCISNCFAFTAEQMRAVFGVEPPAEILGVSAGLPGLPDILQYIDLLADCLRELCLSRRCAPGSLRAAVAALSPGLAPRLPPDQRLADKCRRFVDAVTPAGLQEEVRFVTDTHYALTRLYRDHMAAGQAMRRGEHV